MQKDTDAAITPLKCVNSRKYKKISRKPTVDTQGSVTPTLKAVSSHAVNSTTSIFRWHRSASKPNKDFNTMLFCLKSWHISWKKNSGFVLAFEEKTKRTYTIQYTLVSGSSYGWDIPYWWCLRLYVCYLIDLNLSPVFSCKKIVFCCPTSIYSIYISNTDEHRLIDQHYLNLSEKYKTCIVCRWCVWRLLVQDNHKQRCQQEVDQAQLTRDASIWRQMAWRHQKITKKKFKCGTVFTLFFPSKPTVPWLFWSLPMFHT